jgi:SAM-dependent methyltransferase
VLKYYCWAAAEKVLSIVPFGKYVYRGAALVANANGRSKRRLCGCATAYELVRKTRQMTADGATILDVGTGWHHHEAVLLYLTGANYKIHLFDIVDIARLSYLHTYFLYLLENLDSVAHELGVEKQAVHEKLKHLITLRSREEIYRACNFEHHITMVTDKPFLPNQSVDFMVSNCVLTHIPPAIIEPELRALAQMLKPGGAMYMMVGHEDHWAFHDSSANQFNYYRYSDKLYRLLFDTKFEYQNRMVKSEWLPIFKRAGLEIVSYYPNITAESRQAVRSLPHIDERFASYPLDELATVHSYFLLTHAHSTSPQAAP